MERIDELVADKRRVFEYYKQHLQHLPLAMNPEPEGTTNGYWMPTIVVDEGVPFDRNRLLAAFRADNIDGRVFFWPLSSLPTFKNKSSNGVSYAIFPRALNLPSYHDITDKQMERVIESIRHHFDRQ